MTGGLDLRLWMMHAFPQQQGDAQIYANFARNLLLHGQFAITDGSGVIHPSLIRLPGYPLFLAACFRMFGIDGFNAVAWLQIALEAVREFFRTFLPHTLELPNLSPYNRVTIDRNAG